MRSVYRRYQSNRYADYEDENPHPDEETSIQSLETPQPQGEKKSLSEKPVSSVQTIENHQRFPLQYHTLYTPLHSLLTPHTATYKHINKQIQVCLIALRIQKVILGYRF